MNKYHGYINKFKGKKILILGDLMIDRFVYGTVARISPEAPVPIVEVNSEKDLPGGAGNVANNMSELKAEVHMASVIGNDAIGQNLKECLKKKKINIDGVFSDSSRPTTVKTRIIAHHQQMVRVDKEIKGEISTAMSGSLIGYLEEKISSMDAVLISDYGKGVVAPKVLQAAIEFSRKKKIPVAVDPKIEHFLEYKKITCMTPNLQEAVQGMRWRKVHTMAEIDELGLKILETLQSDSVIITLGEKGMGVYERGRKPLHIPTRAKEVYDVTGAGDTVIAALTLCLSCGAGLRESAELANYAAGVVVAKLGTATVSVEELIEATSSIK